MGIPLIIGVTGHRNIRSEDTETLRDAVDTVLKDLLSKYPHSQIIMLNSLAEGADQLCAEAANALGIPIIAALPMAVPVYEEDFQGEPLLRFRQLIGTARDILVVDDMEPKCIESRDYHYRQAGIYLASHSHVLLALWDGTNASPSGCGTAEIVDFMLNRSYAVACSFFRGMGDGAVIHITAPREGEGLLGEVGKVHIIENSPGVLGESLRMTDDFNHDTASSHSPLPDGIIDSDALAVLTARRSRILDVFRAADALSVRFRDRYLSTILWLSLFGVILVVSFLLYDEMESDLFLILYAGALLMASFLYLQSTRSMYHKKYLEYRVLAEILRNQFYLSVSGISDSVCDYIAWPHERANAWIRQAVSAIMSGSDNESTISPKLARDYWIDGQAQYHDRALEIVKKKNQLNQQVTRGLVIASMVMFVLAVILEWGFKPLAATVIEVPAPLRALLMMHPEQDLLVRSVLKIMVGLISSVTLFLANYYGKLSLNRKIANHEKMVARLQRAQILLDKHGTSWESIYRELARESIIENGEWLTYSRDQPPTINI